MTKRWLLPILFAFLSLSACGSDRKVAKVESDLIATLKSRPSLTQFTKALEATGLAATLQESGSYTIFAPMDAALGNGTALDLATVRHHVLQERVTFSDLAGENTSYQTLNIDEIEVDATDTIKIGDGLMVESDITASNGIIHVIDKVLTPSGAAAITPGTAGTPEAATGPLNLAPSTAPAVVTQ